jgi:sterol desaturase/sphingolipid hydroxylase (fatty acid hydroxylase superfamily)
MWEWIADIYLGLFGASIIVAPEYLALSLLIAWVIYRLSRRSDGFWRWLLPREVYFHRSHGVDLALFLIGRLMLVFALAGRVSLITATAAVVAGLVGNMGLVGMAWPPLAVSFALFLVADFATYGMHRLHHHVGLLWPLHAVHHSASVLTPFTAYRQHPLTLVTSIIPATVVVGAAQGVLVGTLNSDMTIVSVAGVNVFVVLANSAMANFHHSHIWVSFGPVFERLVISPAQHQIHHSQRKEHHDKNFGQTLAVWDWLFGTLYVTRPNEEVVFGLDDSALEPLTTHRISSTLWHPLRRIGDLLMGR